jgi:glycosyltransferase involved in cell wall biosynthesis
MSAALTGSPEARTDVDAFKQKKAALSVVIPAHNSESLLRQCLAALKTSSVAALEIIVVDDASTDGTAGAAESMGADVIRLSSQQGPARARNIGANAAKGEILLFVDSDVCVHSDTLALIAADLENDPKISAVFGSYDTFPAEVDFISQYKNLQHHFFHQTSPARVCTFWSGCGAVRRDLFLSSGGFSVSYRTPAVEDIEFGTRLARAGHLIKLNRDIQVKHLKKWTLGQVIRTDILDRAIPWTEILLRYRQFPNVLNLEIRQRISVLLCLIAMGAFVLGCALLGFSFAAPFLCLMLLALSTYLADCCTSTGKFNPYAYTVALFILVGWAAYLSNNVLLITLVALLYLALITRRLLLLKRPSDRLRAGAVCGLYGTIVAIITILQIPIHWTSLVIAVCGIGVLYINRKFYLLLANSWGRLYAVSAIPFHFLYQMSCAAGLAAGTTWFYMRRVTQIGRRMPAITLPSRMAILDVELSEPFSPLTIEDQTTSSAMVICRLHGRVVGKFEAAIQNGHVSETALQRNLPGIAWYAWQNCHARAKTETECLRASVIVCTRDRADDLARCLKSLYPLLAAGHEIIVVDNRPSGQETSQLVSRYPGVRYVIEPRTGLSAARNCGVAIALHDIVAFTDDDAEVEPGWLKSIVPNFADPTVALVTGLTLPRELENHAQIWFERTNGFKCWIDRREFDFRTLDPLAAGAMGAGVNMAFRKQVIFEAGMFDELLGAGTACKAGEDHELFCRVLARGYRAVYEPEAVVWHRHRREWNQLRTQLYNYGVGVFAWWTRALFVEREFGVLRIGPGYFWKHYVRNLFAAVFGRAGCMPLDLAYAEISGAVAGPWIYFRERRRQHLEQDHARQAGTETGECDPGRRVVQAPRRTQPASAD